MLVLGIESSCDETAVAIVRDGRYLISNVVYSQIKIHSEFGGVVPEIASRSHVDSIVPVIDECLKEAKLQMEHIDAIAVTAGPGLAGSLLVGVTAAKAIAYYYKKPLYAIHHIASHIAANFLTDENFDVPFLSLVVSGGHTHLITCDKDRKFKIIGKTQDDAAGEALDKIARALGLPYPGGPIIEHLARNANKDALKYPRIKLNSDFDFSFSGLKTCALNYINRIKMEAEKRKLKFEDIISIEDFVASYQNAIFQQLLEKTALAIDKLKIQKVALAGGVAANQTLQNLFKVMCDNKKLDFFAPDKKFCTDNAAMVATMAYYDILAGKKEASLHLDAKSIWDAESYLSSEPISAK